MLLYAGVDIASAAEFLRNENETFLAHCVGDVQRRAEGGRGALLGLHVAGRIQAQSELGWAERGLEPPGEARTKL